MWIITTCPWKRELSKNTTNSNSRKCPERRDLEYILKEQHTPHLRISLRMTNMNTYSINSKITEEKYMTYKGKKKIITL